ncbi:MAG: hypothetical protein ACRETZ_06250 [Steroidobacteraceae bacterium]
MRHERSFARRTKLRLQRLAGYSVDAISRYSSETTFTPRPNHLLAASTIQSWRGPAPR